MDLSSSFFTEHWLSLTALISLIIPFFFNIKYYGIRWKLLTALILILLNLHQVFH